MVFAVILESKRHIVVPDNWVQNPTISGKTKIFFSPDARAQPNFNLGQKYLFNKNMSNVYEGYALNILVRIYISHHSNETLFKVEKKISSE